KRGEVLGIIGRNGAGKTTLLKILSRITEPTEGRAEIHGRVGSLLEVGTGFHSELTGRENVYLNGAILGMKRTEIDRKFDEIVAFSEIERFLDTPVKRYSSGMRVRLAFAVAAHLEPEIMLEGTVASAAEIQSRMEGVIRREDPFIRLQKIALLYRSGRLRNSFHSDEDTVLPVVFECLQPVQDLRVLVRLVDESNLPILVTQNPDDPSMIKNCSRLAPGVYQTSCVMPANTLGGKRLFLTVHLICSKTEHLAVNKIVES
ncbi:unnamed protein product, partial [marine sediment metagenome]